VTNLSLKEYHWDNSAFTASGGTLVFDPNPATIKKSVQTTWRVRRAGLSKKIEKAKWRCNEEIHFTVDGQCSPTKRKEIEFYSKRNSVFEIVGGPGVMDSPFAVSTDDSTGTESTYWDYPTSTANETLYVAITKVDFTESEGRHEFPSYTLELKRVNPNVSKG